MRETCGNQFFDSGEMFPSFALADGFSNRHIVL